MSSRVCVAGQSKGLVCPAVSVRLGNQRAWYVQPCLCDWVIKGLGMSSRVCATG